MFIPLHYQTSEYDCVPTSVTNAVSCLFERHEVPPMVIRHIHSYSLDTVSSGARLGLAGTSRLALQFLGSWLGRYRTARFSVTTEYLSGGDVNVDPDSHVLQCLQDGGVALLNVRLSKGEEHFVTAMEIDDGWMRCWDPYYRKTLRGLGGRARRLDSDGRSPNLEIRLEWLAGEGAQRFSLGPRDDREALLIWRNR